MNTINKLKLGLAFTAALAVTGCEKALPPDNVQARMNQIFSEIDQLPLTTTTHSLQVWSALAEKNSICAITFSRAGRVDYDTTDLGALKIPLTEAVRVSCDDLKKAEDAAKRDLDMKDVDTIGANGSMAQGTLEEKLSQARESFKNKVADNFRYHKDKITDIRLVPPPAPYRQ